VLLELFSIDGMRRRVALVAALVALFTTAVAVRAPAQQTDKQRQLAEDIEETSKAAQQARAAAVQYQQERTKLDATLTDLSARVAAAQAALAAAQAEVERLGFESFALSVEIEETQAKLAAAEADTKASAVLLYKRPDSASVTPNLIGSTQGSGSIVEARQYLKHVSEKRRNDLARAQRLRTTLGVQKDELDAQARQAEEARAQAEASKNEIDALYAQQQSARDSAATAQSNYEASAAEHTAEVVALEAEKAKVDAEIRAIIAASTSSNEPPMGNGQFLRPVGGSISSGFGNRTDPVTGASAFHAGIDFAGSCGTPIKAAGNGTVVSAGWQGGYGNATIINHGGGMATLYGHQQSFAVGAGQSVTAGQVIGSVGSTGKSTGCHLHFEVRVNGNPVDARAYL
jgi:murein DD-endopeptidase MepM/ murein hydrolase activator NlpD